MKDEVETNANKLKPCHIRAKTVVKIFINIYALLRLTQAITYLLWQRSFISPTSTLAIIVGICSILLLTGSIGESEILLEIWMVWTVLKLAAMIFSVFDLSFENFTFFSRSTPVNIAISSGEFKINLIIFVNSFIFCALVLQFFTFFLVLKLYKTLSREDDCSDYFTDFDDARSSNSVSTENQTTADAVAFEPCLFTNVLLMHT